MLHATPTSCAAAAAAAGAGLHALAIIGLSTIIVTTPLPSGLPVQVLSHKVWIVTCVAYTLYTAVLGVFAFWGPKAGRRIFGMESEASDLIFGAVTVLTGVLGSAGGGMALDGMGPSLRNASLVCACSCLAGLPLVLAAFLLAQGFPAFMGLFAAGELSLFLLQAPVAAINMWAVPSGLRPLAISLNTVAIHLLGDVPSPPLLGWIETLLEQRAAPEQKDQQWRLSMSIISLLLVVAGGCFLYGARLSGVARDYRHKAALVVGNGEQGVDEGPLLEGRQPLSSMAGSSSLDLEVEEAAAAGQT
jgi:hypothetical protein